MFDKNWSIIYLSRRESRVPRTCNRIQPCVFLNAHPLSNCIRSINVLCIYFLKTRSPLASNAKRPSPCSLPFSEQWLIYVLYRAEFRNLECTIPFFAKAMHRGDQRLQVWFVTLLRWIVIMLRAAHYPALLSCYRISTNRCRVVCS